MASFTYLNEEKPDAGFTYLDDAPPKQKQNTGIVGDIGTALKRGVLQMPGMATGLADIAAAPVSIATGVNRPVSRAADWIREQTGFQPGKWAEAASAEYSPEMQQAQQNVEQAKGFFPTLGAVAQNPRVAAQVVAESLPSTIAGGLLARGAMGAVAGAEKLAALRAAAGSADAAVANAARRELLRSGAIAAGVGEGAVTAGQQMVQTGYDVDPALAAGAALGAGVGTGIIGGLSGRIASSAIGRKIGLSDIETSMAAGTLGENAGKAGAAGLAKRIGAGAIQEGLLEEAPQSYQEQVWQNLAAGKPLTEGAAEAAALGAVAGGVMGAGVNIVSGPLTKAVAAAPGATVPPAVPVSPAGIASAAQFPQFTAPPQPVTGGAPLEQAPTAMPVPQATQNAPAAPGSPSPVSAADPLPSSKQAEAAGAPIQQPQGPLPSANQTEVSIPPAQGPEAASLPAAAKPAKGIAAALQYPQQVTESGAPLAQQPADMRPGSWVIKNKTTGEVILETFDKKKVDALNTNKYEAVPILEYLQGINRSIKNGTLPIQSNGNSPKTADISPDKSPRKATRIASSSGIAGALVTPQQPTVGGSPLEQTPVAMPIGEFGKRSAVAPSQTSAKPVAESLQALAANADNKKLAEMATNKNPKVRAAASAEVVRREQSGGQVGDYYKALRESTPEQQTALRKALKLKPSANIVTIADRLDGLAASDRKQIFDSVFQAAQAEVKSKADGRESYVDAMAAVAKEMRIGTNADGEYDATDDQFDEMDRRTRERMTGKAPVAPRQTPPGAPQQPLSSAGERQAAPTYKKATTRSASHYRVRLKTPLGNFDVFVEKNKDSSIDDYKRDAKNAFAADSNMANLSGIAQISFDGNPEPVSDVSDQATAAKNAKWARIAKVEKAAAQPQPKPRQQPQPAPIMRRDDLVGAIMRVTGGDGIASNMALTIAKENAGKNLPKLRGLFTNRGWEDLGEIATLLRNEEGFSVRDGEHLSQLIEQAASGTAQTGMARTERDLDAERDARHRETIRQNAKKLKIKSVAVKFTDLEQRVIAALTRRHERAVELLDERAKRRFDAALEESYALLPEDVVDAVLVDVSGRGLSPREFWNQATETLRYMVADAKAQKEQEALNAIEGAEPDWLKDDDRRGNQQTGGRGEADRVAEEARGEAGQQEGNDQVRREVVDKFPLLAVPSYIERNRQRFDGRAWGFAETERRANEDPSNWNFEGFSVELTAHQLQNYKNAVTSINGALLAGSKGASPTALISSWSAYNILARGLSDWMANHPKEWADYKSRQSKVESLKIGDSVVVSYERQGTFDDGPDAFIRTIKKKNKVNWSLDKNGISQLHPPASLLTIEDAMALSNKRERKPDEDARGEAGFDLAAQTPEEIAAAEAAAKAAEAKAEKEKKAAEDAQKKAELTAEVKKRSEAAADTFELGGNAMDNLTGQKDIFAAPAPAPAAKPNPDQAAIDKANADFDDALNDLGDIIGKPFRANFTPEQEQKLIPVLTRLMDAAFRKGYYKFKEAARFVLESIGAKFGKDLADQITLDHLQGAYIGMAGRYKDQGADSAKAVVSVEDRKEVEPRATDELPPGWVEAYAGGMATNKDNVYGGIVDTNLKTGKWFFVPQNDNIGIMEGFDTRREALDALSMAVEKAAKSTTLKAKGLANVTNERSGADLERDSQDANIADGMGAQGVPVGAGGNGSTRRPGVAGSGAEGSQPAGGNGLRDGEAAIAGERGNLEVHTGATKLSPGSAGNSVDLGGDSVGVGGLPIEPDAAIRIKEAARGGIQLEVAKAKQRAADKAPFAKGLEAIRQSLPILTEGQQEDVFKTETRFAVPDGYGMLFTNGTGTGKTFSALGVIKRFAAQGKQNILVVAPSQEIISAWQKAGKLLGLDLSLLEDINDAGSGMVITTYANMGANNKLASRDWDLIVHDEAHYLSMNKDGTNTESLNTLRAISLHPDGALRRAIMLHGDIRDAASIAQKQADIAAKSDDARDWPMAKVHQARANKLNAEFNAKHDAIKADVAARQLAKRPRVMFLSATPFAYEKSVDWANGYLFDYNEGRGDERNEFRGYNAGSNSDQFMMQHFGYRMRYGKLTAPDAKVDSGLMQRQFNSWLKKSGSLSGRMLDVDADYDRRFILVDSAIGQRIDEALQWFDTQRKATNDKDRQAAISAVQEFISEKFDYLSRRYLLESIKAKEVVPHVREHLAMGRKVVVFHDYKKGGGFNPFIIGERTVKDQDSKEAATSAAEWNGVVGAFNAEFKDIINSDLFKQTSPILMFKNEFPGVLLFNGDVSVKERRANVQRFQDDASGPQVILVQSAAGKEGISLHDTTGKHQRVLFNLGQPTQPTTAIQQEGRIYRTGQVTDAIFRYLNTGTNWEKWAFATTIANRASAAENLGMGELARSLKDAFIAGFEESDNYRAGMDGEGKGGKERDKAANNALTEYDRARAFYFGTQKKNGRTKAQEGADYFATPEPVGLKMVEWANVRPGEKVLEPSAGHGAIARWMPATAERTAVEPSMTLRPRLAMVFDGQIIDSDFESLNVVNKYDAIVMNPPFGSGGKTAIDHLAKAATHLRDGGRIVALLPTGPAADKKFEKWFYEEQERPVKPLFKSPVGDVRKGDTVTVYDEWAQGDRKFVVGSYEAKNDIFFDVGRTIGFGSNQIKGIERTGKQTENYNSAAGLNLVADIKMPPVTFERAGTAVSTRIVVIEKSANSPQQTSRDFSDVADINTLFDRMENMALPDRAKEPEPEASSAPAKKEKAPPARVGDSVTVNGNQYAIEIYTTNDGKDKRGIWMEEKEAKAINPRAFKSSKMRGTPAEGKFFVDEYWLNKRAPDSSSRFSFAGQQSATADQFQLDRAKQLLADGANANAVRQQTGWFKNPSDGKWRYEIDDSGASLKAHGFGFGELLEAIGKNLTLAEVLDHPALFAAYPSIAGSSVEAIDEKSQNNGELVTNKDGGFTIRVNAGLGEAKALSVMLHEIQHGIQNVEGFASGGSPSQFGPAQQVFESQSAANEYVRKLPNPFDARIVKDFRTGKIKVIVQGQADPYQQYKKLAGEVESRNVQQRQNFPADKRKYSDPLGTQDVAPEDVIVVFNGMDAKDAPAPANTTRASAMAAVGASPADAAVFDMASEGKSAQEILAFLSKASRRPFNRVLAAALSRIGVSSTVSIDQAAGWRNNRGRNGAKFAASYSPKTDTVALYTPREAERHVLHEFVHAASLKAIARGGPAARQMQSIFDYVQRTGTMSDQYGMGNFSRFPNETDAQFKKRMLDEFTAELFTNPQFQLRLKQLPAPSGSKLKSAWDWIVRVIANLLGLKTKAQETALDRALSVGAALLQENASLTMQTGQNRYSAGAGGRLSRLIDATSAAKSRLDAFDKGITSGKVVDDGKYFDRIHAVMAAESALAGEIAKISDDALAVRATTSDGRMVTLTKSAQQEGKYQITRFDAKGEPWGDTLYPTKLQAAKEFVSEVDVRALEVSDGTIFSQERPFSGREVAATPLKPGTKTLMVDGVERPALNSNGNPIHWSEEGVRNFYAWFKDSKVVDEQGRPLVVYHGTTNNFSKFEDKEERNGFYFAERPEYANLFADGMNGSNVLPVSLNIRNPADLREGISSDLFKQIKEIGYSRYGDLLRWTPEEYWELFDGDSELRTSLERLGFDGVKLTEPKDNDGNLAMSWMAFAPEQAKSATGNTGAFSPEDPDIRYSLATNWQQSPVAPGNLYQSAKKKAASLLTPERLDKVIYETQDKFIDLRRIRDHIKEIGGTITDLNDAYLGEELYHKRLAYRTEQFLKEELQPFFADMKARDVTMPEFEKFLHARHAPEANDEMAKRNPNQKQIDAGRQKSAAVVRGLELNLQTAKARGLATVAIEKALTDARAELVRWNSAQAFKGTEAERLSLSGMSNADARALMASLTPAQRSNMDALAAKVDAINEGTLQTLERYGLMDKTALNTWRNTYKHYVPLHRDEAHPDSVSHPIGQGFNVRGDASKRRTGSNQEVTNIFSHIAMQREAALTRGEKNRVMQKLYLMARQNPIADIWSVGKVPMIDTIDKATGFVKSVPDPQYKDKKHVITLRVGGKDVAIVMNEYNPQALRLAQSIKNLDVDDLHYLIPVVGNATRWFASINTQYNPIFGLINFARDVQTAALNLSTTEIAGKQKEVFKDTMSILGDIIKNKGRMPTAGKWAPIYKEFNEVGGTTGYRDLFLTAEDRSKAITDEIKALDRGKVSQAAHAVAGWLSDYNEAMENATRLAAYKAAIDNGMSKERAASLAKNLTVNFNRKGRQTRELGALYAFFNAAVQGTARMAQTLSGPAGKKIMLGGVLAGAASAMAGIAAMGGSDGEDDEWSKIPEFVKERSFIIPAGKDKYISIPMPLGFHFLPNIGRLMVEMAVYKDKTLGKQMASLFTVLADAFNPLGGSAPPMQIIAPTVMDPFIALAQNKDWTGKPIYVENFNSLNPQPGAARAKDSATPIAKGLADAINAVTGGTKYVPGGLSPTPDQIDYVIGQLTGGIGREIGKLSSTISAPFTGDELPAHKIPLLGRLYGSTAGATGQAGKFYENIKRANEVENELKGRRKDGIGVDDYLRENPKAVELAARGNAAERQIRALRQMRSRIVEAGGTDAASKARQINERMATVMRGFNMQVERMQ